MGAERQLRGARAEQAAQALLARSGLTPVAANARFRGGELDLVMLDGTPAAGTLVFVEVRYRRSADHGGGAASVDAGKQHRLIRAAQAFLAAHPHWLRLPCRFDVVEADGDPDAPRLHWIRDAFRLDG